MSIYLPTAAAYFITESKYTAGTLGLVADLLGATQEPPEGTKVENLPGQPNMKYIAARAINTGGSSGNRVFWMLVLGHVSQWPRCFLEALTIRRLRNSLWKGMDRGVNCRARSFYCILFH